MEWLPELVVAIVAYLAGSLPTGYLVARAYGVDIRQVGSGNIGATNVLRSVNRWAGRGVFVVDMLKGFLPAFLAPLLLPQPVVNLAIITQDGVMFSLGAATGAATQGNLLQLPAVLAGRLHLHLRSQMPPPPSSAK